MKRLAWGFLALTLSVLCTATVASAHSQSYGYLTLRIDKQHVAGDLSVAVRDLELLYRLDADADGKITWGEVRSRENVLARDVLSQVSIARAGQACGLTPYPLLTEAHGGESYIVFPLAAACPAGNGPVSIGYRLLFHVDAQHRAFVSVTSDSGRQTGVLTPGEAEWTYAATDSAHPLTQLVAFIRHGVQHIWMGYDHILFLLTLLLGTWATTQAASSRAVLIETTKVVSAFTLSHSLTLGLAAFGVLRIPPAYSEAAIAVTIMLAAVNNIVPILSSRVWLIALIFGLVHGIGFANVLADMDLGRGNMLISLAGFNLGVEFGQLAIVVAAFPLLVLARSALQRPRVAALLNLSIIAVGAMWFSDRSFGTVLMPF